MVTTWTPKPLRFPLSSEFHFPTMAATLLNLHLPILSQRRIPSVLSWTPKHRFSVKASTETDQTSDASTDSTSLPGLKTPPQPKRFYVRPDKVLDIFGAFLAFPLRAGTGAFASGYSASFVSEKEIPSTQYATKIGGFAVKETSKLGPRPEKPIEIYEYEGCPFCRKVREIVTVLDLDVLYYPCPRNGPNFRPKAFQLGGKKQFPYMVDPNTGAAMYESDDIIKYLVDKYGDGTIPPMLSLGLFTSITAGLAMIGRAGKGSIYTPAKLPELPIEIWSYEASPFCKIVREVLVELELPHLVHSVARGSPKRQQLFEKVGHFQAPYLDDPNTGVKMFESAEIIDYLRTTYALPK